MTTLQYPTCTELDCKVDRENCIFRYAGQYALKFKKVSMPSEFF